MKLVLAIFCVSGTLLAQGPAAGRRFAPVGPRGAQGMIGATLGRTVEGAPYSAVEVRESTQTLPNGNVIARKSQSSVYRDGMGRVRIESTIQPRGRAGQTAEQTPRTSVMVHDPVAGVTREWNSTAKTAREIRTPQGRGRGANGFVQPVRGNRQSAVAGAAGVNKNPNVVTEALPMQTVNGVQATGTRVTRTIPAGQIGNAQAIQMVHETWISPDLKVPVMVKDTDRQGRTSIRQLTNIVRSEPDPALFQTPSDYTVTKIGRGRGAARR